MALGAFSRHQSGFQPFSTAFAQLLSGIGKKIVCFFFNFQKYFSFKENLKNCRQRYETAFLWYISCQLIVDFILEMLAFLQFHKTQRTWQPAYSLQKGVGKFSQFFKFQKRLLQIESPDGATSNLVARLSPHQLAKPETSKSFLRGNSCSGPVQIC